MKYYYREFFMHTMQNKLKKLNYVMRLEVSISAYVIKQLNLRINK